MVLLGPTDPNIPQDRPEAGSGDPGLFVGICSSMQVMQDSVVRAQACSAGLVAGSCRDKIERSGAMAL